MDRVLVGDIEKDEEVSGGVLEHAGDIYAQCGDMEGALKYWTMAQEKGGDVSQLLKKKIQLKSILKNEENEFRMGRPGCRFCIVASQLVVPLKT